MISLPELRKISRERKRQGYEKNGYKIVTEEGLKNVMPQKCVLITKERKGAIDSTEIQKVIDETRRLMRVRRTE